MITQQVSLPDGSVRTVKYNPQRVVPIKDIDINAITFLDKKGNPAPKQYFWRQLEPDGSWYSERFGHRYPAVIVEDQEDGSMLYKGDCLLRVDGPTQPYGSATPSAIGIGYRRDAEGNIWFRGFLGYRPTIENPKTKEMGLVTLQVWGGYGLDGEDPMHTALRQALEEGGAILKNVMEVGAGSSNRMDTTTCIRVFLAEYDIDPAGKKSETAQGYEKILGDVEFRADQIPVNVCFDFIVAAGMLYAVNDLSLISPKPIK